MELYPGNKRYHTLDYHLKQLFGTKVVKISLNAGFTCPNIDGTCGTGGCTYCSSSGSGDFAGVPTDSLKKQFEEGKERLKRKWPVAKYIPYFQAHTNTYAPLSVLKGKFETALSWCDVVGLSVATRADCLPKEVLDYLEKLNELTYLSVELGLQTIHNQTALAIHRGHDYQTFEKAVYELSRRNIPVCVHIINGLPGETYEMMLQTAKVLARLPISSLKIHMLYLVENTQMGDNYQKERFHLLTCDEYVNIVCDQLEILPKNIVIERLTGDGAKDTLIGPIWSKNKVMVRNEIDKELKLRGSYQGIYFAE